MQIKVQHDQILQSSVFGFHLKKKNVYITHNVKKNYYKLFQTVLHDCIPITHTVTT